MTPRPFTPPAVFSWRKRAALVAAALSLSVVSCARLTPPPNYTADFDQFCADIAENYAYFHERPVDWSSACGENRPFAEHAVSRDEFIGILEKTLGELHDFHAHLATSNHQSPRLVPTESDLRVRWQGGRVVITDVRATSAAEKAGARPGMEAPRREAPNAARGRRTTPRSADAPGARSGHAPGTTRAPQPVGPGHPG